MAYELHLKLYDRYGVQKRGFIAPVWARYTDSVDTDDPLIFYLHEEADAVESIEEFDIVEVMIRNRDLLLMDSGGGFVRALVAIVRDFIYTTDDNGETFIEYRAPSANHILSWRSVLWYAGVDNRSSFSGVAAETLMKLLVTYNFTANATTGNGRQRNGDLLPGMGLDISVVADSAGGNVLSGSFTGKNILVALQKLTEQAGGDFALSWDGGIDWSFDFYPGQLGDDKSFGADRVLFSLKNNTMKNPRLIKTGAKSSVALAAGAGPGEERQVSEVLGPDYGLDYDIEIFVDARQEKESDGRAYRGRLKLEDLRAKQNLSFTVLQTSNQFYSPVPITGRKTYKAGDIVLAVYQSEAIRKIEKIQVYWNDPQNEDAFVVDVITREVVENGS